MKRQFPFTTLLLAGCILATNSNADPSAPDPRDRLSFFAGEWTVKGSEATYTEKCEWLSKNSFVVCNAVDTDPKDPGTSISIFGYSPEDQTYTYAGFDSSGGSRTLRGWFNTEAGFHFRQEVSQNGASWATTVEIDYLRAR